MSVQDDIIAKYGEPDANYEAKFCILWDIIKDFPELSNVTVNGQPLKHIEINKDFKDKFSIALINLRNAGLLSEFHTFDGCLEKRNTRGSTKMSLHSWALAMDWNAATNKLLFYSVKNPFELSTFTKPFINIMTDAGLFWGGYYKNRFDPMHFSLFNG